MSQIGANEIQNRWFDVAVPVEREVTGTAARRMVELYQVKNTPLPYDLVRSDGSPRRRTIARSKGRLASAG